MASNLEKIGFKSIVSKYDLFFIDIWGVIHNGISLFESAVEVLNQLENLNKKYVLLTNAPRPNINVIKFLENMKYDQDELEKLYLEEKNMEKLETKLL